MPTDTPSGQPKTPAAKTDKPMTARQVWARAQLLVEALLKAMESEVGICDQERSDQWQKLFGPKESAVANLQKLVVLLAALQQQRPMRKRAVQTMTRANEDEIAMFADWVRTTDASAANVSRARE